MQDVLEIQNYKILPGERVDLEIPLASLYSHTAVTLPVKVIRGKKPGPRLFISAAIHGDEIIGVEIIRRLLALPKLRSIRGDLVLVPVVNVYGFLNHDRYLPDRRDLNRCFPGSKNGSLASRLANLFMEAIVVPCTHGIDIHTGAFNRANLPQVRACLDHAKTRELAQAFGAPVIIDSNLRDGSLRQAVYEMKRPILLYEAGETLRFDESAIRAGVKGVLSVMGSLGMINASQTPKNNTETFIARSSLWVRAPKSGILRRSANLGTRVQKGDFLGFIGDPFGESQVALTAPNAGIIIGRTQLPLVIEGTATFHIATLDKPKSAQKALEEYQQSLSPEEGLGPSGEPPSL